MHHQTAALALTLVAGLAPVAAAQYEPVILRDVHAGITGLDQVPGEPNRIFTNTGEFGRTPTTGEYVVVVTTEVTSGENDFAVDQFLFNGDGLTLTQIGQEGPTSYTLISVTPVINDAGTVGFYGTDIFTDLPNQMVTVLPGGVFDIVAVESEEAPAAFGLDEFGNDVLWGDDFDDEVSISETGQLSFVTEDVFFAAGDESEVAVSDNGNTIVARTNVFVPANQTPPSSSRVLDDIDAFFTSQTESYILLGDLETPNVGDSDTNDVLILDGAVVAQEGTPFAGTGFTSPVSSISDAFISANGDWVAEGSNDDGTSWFVLNGTPIAIEGEPIVPGASRVWESFTAIALDPSGNYVLTGRASGDDFRDEIAVFNGSILVVSEGDGINNDADDAPDLFVDRATSDHALPGDGFYYFGTALKAEVETNSNVGGNNASLLRVAVDVGDLNGDGAQDTDDLLDAVQNLADFNNSGEANFFDILTIARIVDAVS